MGKKMGGVYYYQRAASNGPGLDGITFSLSLLTFRFSFPIPLSLNYKVDALGRNHGPKFGLGAHTKLNNYNERCPLPPKKKEKPPPKKKIL